MPCLPPGLRIYAVGDIHGCSDLLAALHRAIARDAADFEGRRLLIHLGDYVDRGPDSRGVLDMLVAGPPPGFEAVNLMGNHEEVVLRLVDGDTGPLRSWLMNGGDRTMSSYGIDWDAVDSRRVPQALRAAVPAEHLALLRGLPTRYRAGDYLFVHAGVNPRRPLDRQRDEDLVWIREPFLRYRKGFGAVVVHGHSISRQPEVRDNRIGIDTGAFGTGLLTCLVLEGDGRRFLFAEAA